MANAIVKSQIANDKDGSRHMFVNNRHAAPQLFTIMLESYNLRGSRTCKSNIVGCNSEILQLGKSCNRGTFVRKVDERLGIVISGWKDIKNL